MTTAKRVLVTGSAGRLGRAAVRELTSRGHHVFGFDLVPTPGLPADRAIVGTLQDLSALRQAMSGMECLIHLAATPDDARFPRGTPPDDGDNFVSELLPNNILGGYHVMEAARMVGVPRIIIASTGQVIDGHLDDGNIPVTQYMEYRPRYLYACTKVFLEAVGRAYSVEHKMQVLAVRLGWCPRDARQVAELARSTEDQDVYLSPGDAGRFFAAAVEVSKLPLFDVVYVTSRPLQMLRYDLEPARKLVGFEPQDQWPTGAEK